MKNKALLLMLGLMFISTNALSQNLIQGKITGSVQAGITIELYNTSCGYDILQDTFISNSEGYYAFGCLDNGSYKVVPDNTSYTFIPTFESVQIPQTELQSYDFTVANDSCATVDRFVDNIDGTVTDCRTDLVWLKSADCLYYYAILDLDEYMDWDTSMSLVAKLNSGECGLSDGSAEGDWRLPTIEELQRIGTDPPATWGYGLPSVTWKSPSGIFNGLIPTHYWSSTKYSTFTVWYISLQGGWSEYEPMTGNQRFAWPVRSAD